MNCPNERQQILYIDGKPVPTPQCVFDLLATLYVRGGNPKPINDLAFAFNTTCDQIRYRVYKARKIFTEIGLSGGDIKKNTTVHGVALSDQALNRLEFPDIEKRVK